MVISRQPYGKNVYKFFIPILVLILIGCSNANEDDNPLVLELSIEQREYQLGEPIIATLSLVNVSDDRVLVKKRLAVKNLAALVETVDVYFLVEEQYQGMVSFIGRVNPPFVGDENFAYLEAGEEYSVTYNLASLYDLSRPGDYLVMAIYQNSNNPSYSESAWRGEIKSNSIWIYIR